MGKGPKDDPPAAKPGPFNNPFARLKDQLGELPSAPAPAQATPAPKKAPDGPARAIVRYERKGHGGKEVTRIEQLELSPPKLEAWLSDLKRGLGCGGRIEDGAIVLQGDQRERLPALLERRGVRKVTVS